MENTIVSSPSTKLSLTGVILTLCAAQAPEEPPKVAVHEDEEAGDVKSPDAPAVAVPVLPNVTVTLTSDGNPADVKTHHKFLIPPFSATSVTIVLEKSGISLILTQIIPCPSAGTAGNNPTTKAASNPKPKMRLTAHLLLN